MTFVLQETAVFALLNKKEQELLLHHVQLLYLKVWRYIPTLLKYEMPENILLSFCSQNTDQIVQNVTKIRIANFSLLQMNLHLVIIFFLILLKIKKYNIDRSSPSFIKDDSKCIRCQRCVRTCSELQYVSAIAVANKGAHQKISSFHDRPMSHVVCTNCGQCVNRCPTGALVEKTYIDQVWDAIYDPDKHVVVQTAPAVRVALGEDLGYDPGERVTGKMVNALRQLGFSSVLDTDFSADLTIMEEGTELLGQT